MSDDAEPVGSSQPSEHPGYSPTPAEAYAGAHKPINPDERPPVYNEWTEESNPPHPLPATRRIYYYLEGLKYGLAKQAQSQGWRVAEGKDPPLYRPYLLVPDRKDGTHSVILGYRLLDISEIVSPEAPPYNDVPWVDRGASVWFDVPIPNMPGELDRRIVWVCRDPADALLLRSHRVTAISLAAPCTTLGSEEGVRRLAELKALNLLRARMGTVVVVDPAAPLSDEWGRYLRGLFDHVWSVRSNILPGAGFPAADVEGRLSVTGRGLAALVQTCTYPTSDRVADLEELLLERVREVGHECEAMRVRLDLDVMSAKAGEQVRHAKRVGQPDSGGPPSVPVRSRTAAQFKEARIKASEREVGDWLLKPFLQPGRFTDVQGDAQIGKTSFLLALISAVVEGSDFLGEPSDQTDVVYVTEQSDFELRDNMDASQREHPRIHILTSDDYIEMSFQALLAQVEDLRHECEARLVVFDTIFNILEMTGGQASTSRRVNELFHTLRPLTAAGAAVLLVRHGVDEGGSQSKSGAGPRSYNGRVSTSIRFRTVRHNASHRKLEINSRRRGKSELVVRRIAMGLYDLAPESLARTEDVSTEDGRLFDLDSAVLKVLHGVVPPGLESKEIVRRLVDKRGHGPKRSTVDKSLVRLVDSGAVEKTGSGKGRAKYFYALANP